MSESNYQKALAQLVSLVESSDESIFSQDLEYRITSWNLGAKKLYGYESDEIIGQSADVLVPMSFRTEQIELVVRIKNDDRLDAFDTRRKHQDGHLIDVSLRLSPIHDSAGNLVGVSNISHDISYRKRIERKLAQLASIVDSSDDAIVSTDLDGVIDSWNEGATRLFGYTTDEVIGKEIGFLIPPGEGDEERPLRKVIETGVRIDHYETVRLHEDGSLVKISVTLSPIRDPKNNLLGVSGIARSIAEHQWFEDAEKRRLVAQEKLGELTIRERDILDQVVAGSPNKAIARKLQLSEKTIEKHRSHLMKKLNVRNLAQLVRIAISAAA